ncbi:MAG: hypothetical protein WB441_02695 [Nocardioidaceae bacterium]
MKFHVKIDGAHKKVVRLRHPGGIATATFELEPGDSFPCGLAGSRPGHDGGG